MPFHSAITLKSGYALPWLSGCTCLCHECIARTWKFGVWKLLYINHRFPHPLHRHYHYGKPTLAEVWRHLSVPHRTIYLEFRAAGISAGSLTPPSCTPQSHSVPHITRCSNLPHVTSQCNVARDWVRYAPFCFCCASRGRKWGPQHHRLITGPPSPPTKRQHGGPLSHIARWYISSGQTVQRCNDSCSYENSRGMV